MTTTTDTELVALLGGEPEHSGPLCSLDIECDVCQMQYYICGYATRGEIRAEFYDCACGGHWEIV
jgi:hypothetical protein